MNVGTCLQDMLWSRLGEWVSTGLGLGMWIQCPFFVCKVTLVVLCKNTFQLCSFRETTHYFVRKCGLVFVAGINIIWQRPVCDVRRHQFLHLCPNHYWPLLAFGFVVDTYIGALICKKCKKLQYMYVNCKKYIGKQFTKPICINTPSFTTMQWKTKKGVVFDFLQIHTKAVSI